MVSPQIEVLIEVLQVDVLLAVTLIDWRVENKTAELQFDLLSQIGLLLINSVKHAPLDVLIGALIKLIGIVEEFFFGQGGCVEINLCLFCIVARFELLK